MELEEGRGGGWVEQGEGTRRQMTRVLGQFKTGPREPIGCPRARLSLTVAHRVHTNGETYTPPHVYAKSHMYVPPACND